MGVGIGSGCDHSAGLCKGSGCGDRYGGDDGVMVVVVIVLGYLYYLLL